MGEVYLAEDPRLRRNVALKLIAAASRVDETARARFVKEARATSALNHPNIVTVYDIGQAGTAHYMAIEYIEGETLREQIRRGPLPAPQVAKAGAQIAAALARAHAEGRTHGVSFRDTSVAVQLLARWQVGDVRPPRAGGRHRAARAGELVPSARQSLQATGPRGSGM